MSDTGYRPTTRRQKLKLMALTVAAVTALWMVLLMRPGAHVREFPPSGTQRPCAQGQTSGCVGGQADVLLLPAAPAASSSPGRAP
jgi:hypothetical protein